MDEDRLLQLTERERQLLRLVADGMTTSKALSRETGLTVGSIDNALQRAAKTLGVSGRESAAERFKALEESSHNSSHVRNSGLPPAADPGFSPPASIARRALKAFGKTLRGPPLGGEEFTLRWDQILLMILRIAAIGIVSVSALVLVVWGLFQTLG